MTTTTATLSIRDRVKAIQLQALTDTVTPQQVRDNLILLVGLFGAVLDESRAADHDYSVVLVRLVTTDDMSVAKAEVVGKITIEYARSREATDVKAFVLEMIRAAKIYLQSLDTEMRHT